MSNFTYATDMVNETVEGFEEVKIRGLKKGDGIRSR